MLPDTFLISFVYQGFSPLIDKSLILPFPHELQNHDKKRKENFLSVVRNLSPGVICFLLGAEDC